MANDSKHTGAGVPSDVDIMMFFDGELSGAEASAVQAYLSDNEQAGIKAAALGQIGEYVRGSIELAADDADDRLASLWSGIDKAINSNGASKEIGPSLVVNAAEERATQALVDTSTAAAGGWFGGWQSHIVTGALVAVAVAVLMVTMRQDPAAQSTTTVRHEPVANPTAVVPVSLRSQEPVVEELEVYNGSGVVMTIPGGGAEDESSSAVIWISDDTDLVEDPI